MNENLRNLWLFLFDLGSSFPFDCRFCIFNFKTRSERNDHIIRHFKQKHCISCDKLIFQIGDDWFELRLHRDDNCHPTEKSQRNIDSLEKSFKCGETNFVLVKSEVISEQEFEDNAENSNESLFNETPTEAITNVKNIDTTSLREVFEVEQNETSDTGQISESDDTSNHKAEYRYVDKVFTCNICNETFQWKTEHLNHINEIHNGRGYGCTQCNKTFKIRFLLTRHERTHVLSDNSVCEICNKVLRRSRGLARHMKLHTDAKKCKYCNKMFASNNTLVKHISNLHKDEAIDEGGHETVSNNNSSEDSTERRENNTLQIEQSSDIQDLTIHTKIYAKPIKCKICDTLITGTDRAYECHLKRYHTNNLKNPCTKCDKKFCNKLELFNHFNDIHGEGSHSCEQCGLTNCKLHKTLSGKRKSYQCRSNESSHSSAVQFNCDICGKSLKSKRVLWSHMKSHINKKAFECKYCHKLLSSKLAVRKHIAITHEGDTKYKCETCGKCCAGPSELKAHQTTHSGVKPFICDYCGIGFNSKFHLSEHLNKHTGERPYSCSTCEKKFAAKSKLAAHIRVHTGERIYKCKIGDCNREYFHTTDLKRHRYSQHGIVPKNVHVCSVCSKVFVEKRSLVKHLETH